MGTRKHRQRQEPLWCRAELAAAPGHPFYQRLNRILEESGFDSFCEERCQRFYHDRLGRPSLPPGTYFRLMLIGFFEGIDSERGIAWRVADSLSLRQFLGFGLDEATPDHVTISRTRRLIDEETHQAVFGWVLEELARRGLLKGKTIGIEATTLEANAAMKSIVRRDTQEGYMEYLKRLAEAEGLAASDAAALRRMDRRRPKKASNAEWVNPHDPEAEITRMKDGRTALAYKAEQAVDMETGAVVAVTAHGGATGDPESMEATLPAAGEAVADLIAEARPAGKYEVHAGGVEEVVADKGYHSGPAVAEMRVAGVRSYVAEPQRGRQKWPGKQAQQRAVYANRRRIQGHRGKALLRRRGEVLERTCAHLYESGALRRLHVRGKQNVYKKLLLQAMACNLALILRQQMGAGTPRAAQDLAAALFLIFLWRIGIEMRYRQPGAPSRHSQFVAHAAVPITG
jgi:transposase